MGHCLLMGQGPGRLGFPKTGSGDSGPRRTLAGGQRLAAEVCKSHPHWQKESGVLRTASVGDTALGK